MAVVGLPGLKRDHLWPLVRFPLNLFFFSYIKLSQDAKAKLLGDFGDSSQDISNKDWPLGLRQVNTHEVDRNPREGNPDANEGIDGVTV